MTRFKQISAHLATFLVMAMTAVFPLAVHAQGAGTVPAAQPTRTINEGDLGIQYGAATGLGVTDVRVTIAQTIKVAMGLLGIIAVVIILIGGFTWMTAGGNEEKVGEAKKWIFSGIIGLAIILSAYAIANFVVSSLVTATTSGGNL